MDKIKNAVDSYDLAFILVCIVCAILVLSSFKYLIFADGADEGYYLRYSTLVSQEGFTIFPELFKSYISNNRNWIFPNPLRIAFIAISALWVGIFGKTYIALSSLSLFCYLLTLGISYYFSKKYFGKTVALLFSILLAFSPLNMAMARRALLDSAANFFLIFSLWMFFDMLNDRKRFKYFIFVIIFTSAILVKETSVLLIPIFILYLLVRKYGLKKKLYLNDLLSVSIYPCLIAGAVYLIASGTPFRALDVIRIILASPSTNRYAVLYCAGPWFRYIVDFVLLSPWVFILAAGFFFNFVSSKERREELLYLSIVFVFYFFILNFFAKNVRYAMLLDMPLRLFSVLMILRIMESRLSRYARTFTYLAVIAIAVYDYLSFYNLFVAYGIYDPVSIKMLEIRQFIPFM